MEFIEARPAIQADSRRGVASEPGVRDRTADLRGLREAMPGNRAPRPQTRNIMLDRKGAVKIMDFASRG